MKRYMGAYHYLRKKLGVSKWLLLIIALMVCWFLASIGLEFSAIRRLRDYYSTANTDAQFAYLTFLTLALITTLIWQVISWYDEKEWKDKLNTSEKEVVQIRSDLAAALLENQRLQTQWDQLLEVSAKTQLWRKRPSVVPPAFIPKSSRKTRFLTLINLKGGVGKTTLAANLAAGLAQSSPALSVLLIDIDFQGTLSRSVVPKLTLEEKISHDSLVHQLYTSETMTHKDFMRLTANTNGMGPLKVICADGNLDAIEFEHQAKFFVDATRDPRFHFRRQLHQDLIFSQYDIVLFDSPPRITTSVVNALACSDFVLIPTKLDKGSIDAIPRTMSWMQTLTEVCPAELLGVVASQVTARAGTLVKADLESYDYLVRTVRAAAQTEGKVFRAAVPHSSKAVSADESIAAMKADGLKVYDKVVKEVILRLGI